MGIVVVAGIVMMTRRRSRSLRSIGRDVSLRMDRILHVMALIVYGGIVVVHRRRGGCRVRYVRRFVADPAAAPTAVSGILRRVL